MKVGAVLVRPGAELPATFYAALTPKVVPPVVRTLGTWLSAARNPRCNWHFPSRWAFPDWIVDRLPRRADPRVGWAFSDLSAAGLDSLLFEYAGLVDRGNNFQVRPGTDFPENVASYLRWKYGGEAGVHAQLDLWAEAQDVRTQGELSVHSPFERADHPTWIKKNPKSPRRQVPVDQAELTLWDSVFMGSVDDPAMANLRDQNRTFLHQGRHLRKYHEGSTLLRRRSGPRVDDDPSPFVTCGQVAGRGDLRKRAGEPRRKGPAETNPVTAYLPVPEGLATFEEWDFHPTAEHLPAITAQFKAHGVEYELEDQAAGYWRSYADGSQDFVPLSEWNRHWDGEKMVPGRKEAIPPHERALWAYARGGQWLCWTAADGVTRLLFVSKTTRPDSLPSRSARKRMMDTPADVTLPERTLAQFLWFDKKKGEYVPPRSFTGQDGKRVHLRPKPLPVPSTAWGVWRRCWAELATVRQLLTEERWEKLAFEPAALFGTDGAYASDHHFADEDFDCPEEEAARRIETHLDTLARRVAESDVDADVRKDFAREIRATRDLVRASVYGLAPKAEAAKLDTMNPRAAEPRKIPVPAANPLEASILDTYRALYKRYTDLARLKPERAEHYRVLAARVLWRVNGKPGPKPELPVAPTAPTPAKEPHHNALLLTRAYAAAQGGDDRASKAREWLRRNEPTGDVAPYRRAYKIRHRFGTRNQQGVYA
jgi:hypothetical protein